MNAASITEQFDRYHTTLPGDRDVMRRRSEALSYFNATGFPNRRSEQYRYTDLAVLAKANFELAAPLPSSGAIERAREAVASLPIEAAAPQLVFVDGHLVSELSVQGPAGVELLSLAEHSGSLARDAVDKAHTQALFALNTAFAGQGAIIRISASAKIAAPIHIVFFGNGSGLAPQPRVVIDMSRDSAASIVQHFSDFDAAGVGWLNIVTELNQAPDSELKLYRFQDHNRGQFHTSLLRASLGQGATLTAGNVDLGGELVRSDFEIVLAEPGASANIYGIAIANIDQHVDNHLCVEHKAPHTRSTQNFRTIAGDNGRGVFNSKVIVHKGAQKIDATQQSDNLLLSRDAEIDTKPELEIYANDVKCSHGATIGELDESFLFYLRARGLKEETARGLLTFAFANTILKRIELSELREQATKRVAGQLPEALDLDELA